MGVTGGFAAMAGLSMISAYNQANAKKTEAEFTQSQYKVNAKLASAQAQSAREEGDIQAGHMAAQTKANVAKQRVAAAATGADVNSGSALDLQSDTQWQGAQNAITIKNNAWRQAWGYNIQADNYKTQATFTGIAGQNEYNNTLLTGGMNAASFATQGTQSYYKYN